jgi:hypothetical protein
MRATTGVATPAVTGGNASSQSRWVCASTLVATGAVTGGNGAAMLSAPVQATERHRMETMRKSLVME